MTTTKPCQDCQRASVGPLYALHCPKCIYCGARAIQRIQKLQITADEKRSRCRQVLADWMAHGHSESELRALAKGPTALQPR